MFLIIPALVALSFIFLFAGLAMAPQPTPVQSRLRTYGTTQPRTLREIEMAEPFSERVILPIIRAIATHEPTHESDCDCHGSQRTCRDADAPYPVDLFESTDVGEQR